MAACGYHSLALTAAGRVYSWGGGSDSGPPIWGGGPLHHTLQMQPTLVTALVNERVVGVAAGDDHSLAVTAHGAVFSWSRGSSAALGHGDQANQLQPTQIAVLANESVVGVAAGSRMSLVLTAKGTIFSFGSGRHTGTHARLGHRSRADQLWPKQVPL